MDAYFNFTERQKIKGDKIMEKQNRLKSWALWASAAGLVFLLLTKVFGLNIDIQLWDEVLTALGTILVGFGILNNPTNKSGF